MGQNLIVRAAGPCFPLADIICIFANIFDPTLFEISKKPTESQSTFIIGQLYLTCDQLI
jgi:hypothetical protein